MAINSVCLTGRLTKEVELRVTTEGKDMVAFTIAVDDFNGEKKVAQFIDCIAFSSQAKYLADYCHKGSMVAIQGKLVKRNFSKRDGSQAYVTEVICSIVNNFDYKKDKDVPIQEEEVKEHKSISEPLAFSDEDLPF